MQTYSVPLVVLTADVAVARQLRRISAGRFELISSATWQTLERELIRFGAACLCVVDPHHGEAKRRGPARALADLLVRHPSAVIVATLDNSRDWVEDVRTLGAWGIAGILDLASDDTDLLVLRRLEHARSHAVRTLLQSELRTSTSGRGRIVVDVAIETVIVGGTAADVARSLHMHRDTLLRWCRAAKLPPPRQIMLWLRLLRACELLDNPGQTVESVAAACGYSANSALSRALVHHIGVRPSRLREQGALDTAQRWISRELARLRSADEQSRA